MKIINESNPDLLVDEYYLKNYCSLNEQEHENVICWRNHENSRKWFFDSRIITLDNHKSFVKSLIGDNKRYYWQLKKGEEELGVLFFYKIDRINKNAYFGNFINPDCKLPGMGFIFDKLALIIAKEFLKLHTLKLDVIEDNLNVVAVHQRMKFETEGILKDFVYQDGIYKNVIIMGKILN